MNETIARIDAALRARFFRSLGDLARLAILDALREAELTAGDVAAAAGLSPRNASKHLACLRECGLVQTRQDLRYVYYRLSGEHIVHLHCQLRQVWC